MRRPLSILMFLSLSVCLSESLEPRSDRGTECRNTVQGPHLFADDQATVTFTVSSLKRAEILLITPGVCLQSRRGVPDRFWSFGFCSAEVGFVF